MNTDKRIEALESALEIWSRRWGWALSEHSLNEAEQQIVKIQRQLEQLRNL